MRRATIQKIENGEAKTISIHALLAESDRMYQLSPKAENISIHALLAESDTSRKKKTQSGKSFLSTLSLRRATLAGPSGPAFLYNFYPRSPCGERRPLIFNVQPRKTISIHALLAESDRGFGAGSWPRGIFLSTLSLRRATTHHFSALHNIFISIHALLAESDDLANRANLNIRHFYPRSPCGERPLFAR